MMMLTGLRRFELIDDAGRRAKLADLGVALLEGDYPPVTHLIFRNAERQPSALTWEAVSSISWQKRQIEVADLDAGRAASPESLKQTVFLKQDILDALIIDLQNRRATRANDLWLEEEDGRLLLRAADASPQAILRRLTRGRLGPVRESALFDWKYVEFLRGDPQAARAGAGYHLRIARLPRGEIARLSDLIPYLHAAELLTLLPEQTAADALEAMSPERQLQIFEELEQDRGVRLLELMAPDIAADLAGHLNPGMARRYLNRMPKEQRARIVELLRYPEDTVGGIMTNDVVTVPGGITVEEARQTLRDRLKGPDFVYFIYVVGDEETRKLRGVLTLRDFLIADEELRIEEVMNSYIVTIHPLESARAAAYRIISTHLAAVPVVGDEGQLLGAVTVDAAVAAVAPSSWGTQAPRVFS